MAGPRCALDVHDGGVFAPGRIRERRTRSNLWLESSGMVLATLRWQIGVEETDRNMLRVLTALAGLCASLLPAAALVGGAPPAVQSIARHVVLIVGGGSACTGVAIAPDLVLTAAHCVHEGRQVPARRRSTAIARRSGTSLSVAAHPQFTPRDDAPDVALVKLAPQPRGRTSCRCRSATGARRSRSATASSSRASASRRRATAAPPASCAPPPWWRPASRTPRSSA